MSSIDDFKEILERNPHLTMADFQELQIRYDMRFVNSKFTAFGKVEHTYAHMGKLIGRLAEYVEALEEGINISPEDIKTKVIPDLQVYSAWLAAVFDVNIEEAYLTRFVGNLRRLHADKIPSQELDELESLVKDRFQR